MRFAIHSGQNAKFFVPAKRATLHGYWNEAERESYIPTAAAVRAGLPYRWRKAFDRSGGNFWFPQNKRDGAPFLTLRDYRGVYLTTVYAIPAA